MNFELKMWDPISIHKEYDDSGKRWYVTGDKRYPSVTTVLSVLSEKGIAKWKAAIGEEKANKISTQAARAGTALHFVAEEYMNKKDTWSATADPISLQKFKIIKPFIDDNIDEVYGIELEMYSDKYMVAGTSDLICRWNGKNTILDFKTSRKVKTRDQILSYFLQGATYGQMTRELYGWEPEQIVILMVTNEYEPLVFVEPINKYTKLADQFYKFYHAGKL